MKIQFTPFEKPDFERFIAWIDSEELLVTIAGLDLKFPLDVEQLSNYLDDTKSIPLNVVVNGNKVIGHAEIIRTSDITCKLDKVIIGDMTKRGKGIGEKLINALLDYAFTELKMNEVALNVYDWNHAAIRCYDKVGFIKNPGKEKITKFESKNWEYFNMIIDKDAWRIKAIS